MIQIYFLLLILFANKFISNIVAVQLIVEKTCNPMDHGPDHCDIQHHKFYLVPNGSKHEHLQKQEHKEKEQEKILIHQIWVDEKVAVFKHNGELFLFHKKYIKKCEIGNDEQNEIMPHPGKIEEGSDDDGEMRDKIKIASNDEDDDAKGISKRNLLKHKEIINHIGKQLFSRLMDLFICGTNQRKSKQKLKNVDAASNSKSHSHHHHHISIDKKEEEKFDTYSARSSFHRENSVAEELSHLDAPNIAIAANEADGRSSIADSAVGHKIRKNVEKIQTKFHQNPIHSFIQPETIINQIQLIQNITENEESNTADEIGRKASAYGDIHSESESEGTDQSSHQTKKKHDEKLFDEKNSESEGTSSHNQTNKKYQPLIVCNREEKWLKIGNVIIRNEKEKCIAKVNVPEKKLLEGSAFRVKDEKEDELFYNLEQIDGHGHKTHFMQKTDIMQKIKIDKDLEECLKEVCHENLLNIETVNSIETIYMKEEHKLD